jgi:ribosomal protein S27AE
VALRWVFSPTHVGLSTRDPFGALTPRTILEGIAGTAEGRALGLRIMHQAAQHLLFGLCPGAWSEVMALIEREPALTAPRRHSLCILQGLGQREERFIGDRLRLDEIEDPEQRHVTLRGEINETSDFRPIFRLSGRVFVDLAEVTRINSMGLQSWINAARGAGPDLELIFERCSTAVVSQLCMVPRFAQTGRVASLHAPYYCERCDEESLLLLEAADYADGTPPRHTCGRCGEPLVFDGQPEVFFAFLDHGGRSPG